MESLGYRALYLPDHFGEQLGPIAALMAAAAGTTTLRVGSLVFDNDYRHPVVLAKEVATTCCPMVASISGWGRAGWRPTTSSRELRMTRRACA